MSTERFRQLGWALCISIALNVFLGGVVAARYWARGRGTHAGPFASKHGFDAPVLGEPWRGRLRHLAPQRESVKQSRERVREALIAEPFDKARLESALVELQAVGSKAQGLVFHELVERVSELSPEERRRLATTRFGLRIFGSAPTHD